VVELGFAFGFEIVLELNPVEGDQLYVTPVEAVIPIPAPEGLFVQVILKLVPASTLGTVKFTLTIT